MYSSVETCLFGIQNHNQIIISRSSCHLLNTSYVPGTVNKHFAYIKPF